MAKLLHETRHLIRVRHYSYRTEEAYLYWIKQYIYFHDKNHPGEMGASEVTAFLPHLAINRKVASSTQNQALSALLFLYRDMLQKTLPWLDSVDRAKKLLRVPSSSPLKRHKRYFHI